MAHNQAQSSGEGSRIPRRLPFDAGERKKIVALAGVAVVCGVVVLVQFSKKGPATASAAQVAAAPVDLEGIVRQMQASARAESSDAEGGRLFASVDAAIDVFVGGARPRAVPLAELRTSVFGLPDSPAPGDGAGNFSGSALKSSAAGDGTAPADDPLAAELAKINLETVLVSTHNRAAIMNGQVLHCGETINEFVIKGIEPGRVWLERGGRSFDLKLK